MLHKRAPPAQFYRPARAGVCSWHPEDPHASTILRMLLRRRSAIVVRMHRRPWLRPVTNHPVPSSQAFRIDRSESLISSKVDAFGCHRCSRFTGETHPALEAVYIRHRIPHMCADDPAVPSNWSKGWCVDVSTTRTFPIEDFPLGLHTNAAVAANATQHEHGGFAELQVPGLRL